MRPKSNGESRTGHASGSWRTALAVAGKRGARRCPCNKREAPRKSRSRRSSCIAPRQGSDDSQVSDGVLRAAGDEVQSWRGIAGVRDSGPDLAQELTNCGNTVVVLPDGSRVVGLDNIGPSWTAGPCSSISAGWMHPNVPHLRNTAIMQKEERLPFTVRHALQQKQEWLKELWPEGAMT